MTEKTNIFLGDLTHNVGNRTKVVPMGIATLACALHDNHSNKISTKLFVYPDKIINEIKSNPPDVIALSNYIWNSRLSLKILSLAKKIKPNILTIMGGPHARNNHEGLKEFVKKNPFIDAYIPFEAEVPFSNLISKCIQLNTFKIKKIGNVKGVYLNVPGYNFERAIIESDGSKKDKYNSSYYAINKYSSPYLNGMLDEFITDPQLSPLLESNRGCPYSCTFCAWGVGSGNKLIKKEFHRFLSEIWYVAERTKNDVWFLADGNFGILKEDVEIAENFKELNKKFGYPKAIIYNTAKNNPERVYDVANILGDLAPVNIAVQAFDKEVLKNIKRKNLSEKEILKFVKNHQKENRIVSTDIIVPNTGESLQSHLNSLKTFFDFKFDIGNINLMRMLPGTEMESDFERNKYGLKTKWRPMDAGWGMYDGEFIFELDENVISSNSVKEEEMYYLKKIHFLISLLWNSGVGKPLLKLAFSHKINQVDLIIAIIKEKNNLLSKTILNPLEEEFRNEWFDTREELINNYSKPSAYNKILSGKEYGLKKLNLKYLVNVLLDKNLIIEIISTIKKHVQSICKIDKAIIDIVTKISIDNLRTDLLSKELKKSIYYKIKKKHFDLLKNYKIIPDDTIYTKDGFFLYYEFNQHRFEKMKNRLLKSYFHEKPKESLYNAFTVGVAKFLYTVKAKENLASNLNNKELQENALKKADEIRAT